MSFTYFVYSWAFSTLGTWFKSVRKPLFFYPFRQRWIGMKKNFPTSLFHTIGQEQETASIKSITIASRWLFQSITG